MINFKKVTILTLLSGFLAINAGFAMDNKNEPPKNPPVQPKKEEIKIGGRTPDKIVHNVVTETNRGVNKVKSLFKKKKNKK